MGTIRIDLNAIHPRLAQVARQLSSEFDMLLIYSGYRGFAEQEADKSAGYSKAGGGHSHHNWGIAMDFCYNQSGNMYPASFMRQISARAKQLGLGWGGDWTDFVDQPHLYLPDWGDTPTPLINKYGLDGYNAFKATWGGSAQPTAPAKSKVTKLLAGGNVLVQAGQIHANNYAGANVDEDGYRGTATKTAGIKVLQTALNADYGSRLNIDGSFGTASQKALKGHFVEHSEKQFLVTALQILLLLKGYNPNGVENPGSFGTGLKNAVRQYQKEHGLSVDGVAGFATFMSLIS